jgi:PHP family Zn ribbon phosphoesterase
MRFYYDLHIHSCLSPCSSDDMTPNNIVHMAKLKGLDLIAVTDHNTCKNCEAVMRVGEKSGLLVLPALELQTSEDIHILVFFPTLKNALDFEENELSRMPKIANREDIFGKQVIMDHKDREIGKIEHLLINSSGISIDEIRNITEKYNGAVVPAHIDKASFSVLEVLGEITEEMGFNTVELSTLCDKEGFLERHPTYKEKYGIITNSDAHYLWDISEKEHYFELEELSIEKTIAFFNGF